MINAARVEPHPEPGEETIIDLVVADFKTRASFGVEKYGTFLQAHNGRDALMDAYQEAIDLVMYLRQASAERDAIDDIPGLATRCVEMGDRCDCQTSAVKE